MQSSTAELSLQAYQAALYAGNVPKLPVAKLDISRFTAVNTAKGRWPLLDLLATTPSSQAAATEAAENTDRESGTKEAIAAMSIEAVAAVITEVAAGIIGDSLEGKRTFPFQRLQRYWK